MVSFVSFPLTADDGTNLQAAANQARDAGAVLVVTLQPWGGLSSVTDQATADVARRLAAFGTQGVARSSFVARPWMPPLILNFSLSTTDPA